MTFLRLLHKLTSQSRRLRKKGDRQPFSPNDSSWNGTVAAAKKESVPIFPRLSSLVFLLVCASAVGMLAADRASTSSYASVKPVLDQPSDLLPAELINPNEAQREAKWRAWSQRQDKAIR